MYVEFDNSGILININYIVNMFKDVFLNYMFIHIGK
jgi:hypothetical protein